MWYAFIFILGGWFGIHVAVLFGLFQNRNHKEDTK